jgi:hypothetical protein
MNRCDCPFARPFAWSTTRDSTCTRGPFSPAVPANDFPPVSPRYQRGCVSQTAAVTPVGEVRGVVISCLLARPLAWSPDHPYHLSLHLPVPTKEEKNAVQLGTATGGGP